jgi:hypothetical protein
VAVTFPIQSSPETNPGLDVTHPASGFASTTAVFTALAPGFGGFITVIGKVAAATTALSTAGRLIHIAVLPSTRRLAAFTVCIGSIVLVIGKIASTIHALSASRHAICIA